MGELIIERVEAARRGENPTVICQMPSGWAVMCDMQYLPGYVILVVDPVVASLNDLPDAQRARFMLDMALIGDAQLEVTSAFRINYAILGNSDPFLHAHIVPRYASEPDAIRRGLPWSYDRAVMDGDPFDADRHAPLQRALAEAINRRLASR